MTIVSFAHAPSSIAFSRSTRWSVPVGTLA